MARQKFSRNFKIEAVKLVTKREASVALACRVRIIRLPAADGRAISRTAIRSCFADHPHRFLTQVMHLILNWTMALL